MCKCKQHCSCYKAIHGNIHANIHIAVLFDWPCFNWSQGKQPCWLWCHQAISEVLINIVYSWQPADTLFLRRRHSVVMTTRRQLLANQLGGNLWRVERGNNWQLLWSTVMCRLIKLGKTAEVETKTFRILIIYVSDSTISSLGLNL